MKENKNCVLCILLWKMSYHALRVWLGVGCRSEWTQLPHSKTSARYSVSRLIGALCGFLKSSCYLSGFWLFYPKGPWFWKLKVGFFPITFSAMFFEIGKYLSYLNFIFVNLEKKIENLFGSVDREVITRASRLGVERRSERTRLPHSKTSESNSASRLNGALCFALGFK